MAIPVDGILIRGSGVTCDEAAMTGESDEMHKDILQVCIHKRQEILDEEKETKHQNRNIHSLPSPLMLSGTNILTGEGFFLVIVVGEKSSQGKIRAALESNPDQETPLQQKLEAIANDIGLLGMISAGITVAVLFLRFFLETGDAEKGYDFENMLGTYLNWWFQYLIVGITIIVVAVPEGLPLAVIISLAYSVRKMLEEKNFVKKLAACEIMGGANNICSDKTGTLTKNEMNVVQIWQGEEIKVKTEDKKYNLAEYI